MKFKQILALMLVCSCVLSTTACGKKNNVQEENFNQVVEQVKPETTDEKVEKNESEKEEEKIPYTDAKADDFAELQHSIDESTKEYLNDYGRLTSSSERLRDSDNYKKYNGEFSEILNYELSGFESNSQITVDIEGQYNYHSASVIKNNEEAIAFESVTNTDANSFAGTDAESEQIKSDMRALQKDVFNALKNTESILYDKRGRIYADDGEVYSSDITMSLFNSAIRDEVVTEENAIKVTINDELDEKINKYANQDILNNAKDPEPSLIKYEMSFASQNEIKENDDNQYISSITITYNTGAAEFTWTIMPLLDGSVEPREEQVTTLTDYKDASYDDFVNTFVDKSYNVVDENGNPTAEAEKYSQIFKSTWDAHRADELNVINTSLGIPVYSNVLYSVKDYGFLHNGFTHDKLAWEYGEYEDIATDVDLSKFENVLDKTVDYLSNPEQVIKDHVIVSSASDYKLENGTLLIEDHTFGDNGSELNNEIKADWETAIGTKINRIQIEYKINVGEWSNKYGQYLEPAYELKIFTDKGEVYYVTANNFFFLTLYNQSHVKGN